MYFYFVDRIKIGKVSFWGLFMSFIEMQTEPLFNIRRKALLSFYSHVSSRTENPGHSLTLSQGSIMPL
jgi:hypothetical protein